MARGEVEGFQDEGPYKDRVEGRQGGGVRKMPGLKRKELYTGDW